MAGLSFSEALAHLAFESIYMMGVMLIMISVIFYTNFKMDSEDEKAFRLDNAKVLFNTSVNFNVGAIGIIAIVALLYGMFWN